MQNFDRQASPGRYKVLNPRMLPKIHDQIKAGQKASSRGKASDRLEPGTGNLIEAGMVTIAARFGQCMAVDSMLWVTDPAHENQLPRMIEEYRRDLPWKNSVGLDTDFASHIGNSAGAMAMDSDVRQFRSKKGFFGGPLISAIYGKVKDHYGVDGRKKLLTGPLPDPIFHELLATRDAHENTAWVRNQLGDEFFMDSNDPEYLTGLLEIVRTHSQKKTKSDAKLSPLATPPASLPGGLDPTTLDGMSSAEMARLMMELGARMMGRISSSDEARP